MQPSHRLTSRNTAFHSRQSIQLESDCLQQLRQGKVVKSIPLDEIHQVNLAFLGGNHAAGGASGYRCRVRSHCGDCIELRNLSHLGFLNVSGQNSDYLKMVVELHERLTEQERTDIEFTQGSNAFYWLGWFGVIASALLAIMIPMMLLLDGGATMLARKAWTFALIPALLGGTFLPLIRLGRNRPYKADELPIEHLPVQGFLEELKAQQADASPRATSDGPDSEGS